MSRALCLLVLCFGWSTGCAALPVVTLGARARFERSQLRSGRRLEALFTCSWSLDAGARARARAQAGASAGGPSPERGDLPSPADSPACALPSTCAWELRARAAALAALLGRGAGTRIAGTRIAGTRMEGETP